MSHYSSLLKKILLLPEVLIFLIKDYTGYWEGQEEYKTQMPNEQITGLVALDETRFLVSTIEGTVSIWDCLTGTRTSSFATPIGCTGIYNNLSFSSESGIFYSCSSQQQGSCLMQCNIDNTQPSYTVERFSFNIAKTIPLAGGYVLLIENLSSNYNLFYWYPMSLYPFHIVEVNTLPCILRDYLFVVVINKNTLAFYDSAMLQKHNFKPWHSYIHTSNKSLTSRFKHLLVAEDTCITHLLRIDTTRLVYVTENPNTLICYDYEEHKVEYVYELGISSLKQMVLIAPNRILFVATILGYSDILISWNVTTPSQQRRFALLEETNSAKSDIHIVGSLPDDRIIVRCNNMLVVYTKRGFITKTIVLSLSTLDSPLLILDIGRVIHACNEEPCLRVWS